MIQYLLPTKFVITRFVTNYKPILTPYKATTTSFVIQCTPILTLYKVITMFCYPVYTNTYLIQSHYHVLLSTTNWKLVNTKLFIPPFVTDYKSILKVVTTLFVTHYKTNTYSVQSHHDIVCCLLYTNTYHVQSCYDMVCYVLQTYN